MEVLVNATRIGLSQIVVRLALLDSAGAGESAPTDPNQSPARENLRDRPVEPGRDKAGSKGLSTMHATSSYSAPGRGRRRFTLLAVGCGVLLMAWQGAGLHAQEGPGPEYRIKAGLVYKFLRFVVGGRLGAPDEQAGASADPNGVIRVGVVGQIPSKEGFAELQGKPFRDQHIAVRFFPGFADLKDSEGKVPQQHPQMAEIRQCHALFVCASEKPFLSRLLPPLQREGILLAGDTPGFLEAGGLINFVIEDKKIRFEINRAAAARAKLLMRSSLLRLAVRTIEHDSLERPDDEGREGKSGNR